MTAKGDVNVLNFDNIKVINKNWQVGEEKNGKNYNVTVLHNGVILYCSTEI
jgi:hypothetical protein